MICAIMSEQLPETIKPQSLFDTGGHVGGMTALAKMERLVALLVNDVGTVETQLDFGKDAQGIRFVRGSIKAALPLICQRCLKTMHYPVNIELSLGLVTTEAQADRLSDAYEPLLFESNALSLIALVEDELLLALPLVAKHADEDCNDSRSANSASNNEAGASTEKPHPFAALAQIKGKLGSST